MNEDCKRIQNSSGSFILVLETSAIKEIAKPDRSEGQGGGKKTTKTMDFKRENGSGPSPATN